MKEQPTVYREHVRPICHPLRVDLFQCYYVHYASCGSVQQYNDYISSLCVCLCVCVCVSQGGCVVGGRVGVALHCSYSGEVCSDSWSTRTAYFSG